MAERRSSNSPPTLNLRQAVAGVKEERPFFPDPCQGSTYPATNAINQLPPTYLGDYQVLKELGRGGMGVVFKAVDRALNRVVALKMVLGAHFASHEDILRFRLEGEAAARVQHPNIVQVYEVGTHLDQPYLVLEYVPGGTLASRLDGRAVPVEQAAHLVEVLARACAQIHHYGLIHRDLKPSNILLQPIAAHEDGREVCMLYDQPCVPKITDFGLAKLLDTSAGLTETGRVMGTPEYMAPEQASGRSRDIGPHTDVYALGAILYEVLTGRPPFVATGTLNTMMQVLSCDPPSLGRLRSRLPRDLETICLKCLEKEPQRRYSTAQDLADDLRRFRLGLPISARPIGAVERTWKWARRRPVIAGLITGLVMVTALGFVGVTLALLYALQGWQEAEQASKQAQAERAIAQAERAAAAAAQKTETEAKQRADTARRLAEINLNFGRLTQAQLRWQLNDSASARQQLDLIDPSQRGWQWRYLQGLLHSELRNLSAPSQILVLSVAVSPDGKHVAAAGGNPYRPDRRGLYSGDVAIWEIESGKLVQLLEGFRYSATHVAYSPNGRYIAACSQDGSFCIWEAQIPRTLDAHPTFVLKHHQSLHLGNLNSLSFSPDSRRLALACSKRQVCIYDVVSGKRLAQLPANGTVHHVAYSPDGRSLAIAASTLCLHDALTYKELRRFKHTASGGLIFSPDSRTLALADGQRALLISTEDGRSLHSLAGHKGLLSGVCFSPDGRHLATSGADTTVRLWDVENGKEVAIWRGHTGRVQAVCFHPHGHLLLSGSAQPGEVRLWDLTRPQLAPQPPEHKGQGHVHALAFLPGGKELAVMRHTGIFQIHDVATWQSRHDGRLPMCTAWRVPGVLACFSGDARVVAAVLSEDDHKVCLWDRTGNPLPHPQRLDFPVWQVALNLDGSIACAGGRGLRGDDMISQFVVWETLTGKVRLRYESDYEAIKALTLSPDGKHLASSVTVLGAAMNARGEVTLRPAVGRVDLWRLTGPTAPASCVRSWRLGRGSVIALRFSSDAELLAGATAGGGGQVFLWNLSSTGQSLQDRSLPGPVMGVYDLAFSPNGRLLAGVSRSNVTVWDTREGMEVLSLVGAPPRPSDGGFAPRVSFSDDGRYLAASNWDHSISIWDGGDQASRGHPFQIQAARGRLPRFYIEQAEHALDTGNHSAVQFHLRQLERLEPLDQDASRKRGNLLGRMGQWQKASADLTRALQTGRFPAKDWRRHALLKLYLGDREGYRQACVQMRRQCQHDRNLLSVFDMLMAVSYGPGVNDHAWMQKLAQELMQEPHTGRFLHAKAMAYLRMGRHAEAITASEQALKHDANWRHMNVLNWLTLALAHHHKGEKLLAQRYWEKAHTWFVRETNQCKAAGRPYPSGVVWWDWPWVEMLHQEVAELLE